MPPRSVQVTGRGEPVADGAETRSAPPPVESVRVAPREPAESACCRCVAPEAREACHRESLRLEANKAAADGMLRLFDNPVLAAREHSRFVRDLNRSINLHNSLCKRYPVAPLSSEGVEAIADVQGCHVQRGGR